MNTHVFNTEEYKHPADGWYQIEAKGDHLNRAAGVVQVIDDQAAQSIANSFNADAKAGKLRQGNELLVDIEHFSDQPDKETRAYGWLQELQARPDGIYGRIRWTATGQAAVDGGDYRFFSTEYNPDDCKVLNNGNPQRIRPLKLDGLTLTNMNNNRGQKAITNRDMPSIAAEITLSPQLAAIGARGMADQIQNQLGCTFAEAWNLARKVEPSFFPCTPTHDVAAERTISQDATVQKKSSRAADQSSTNKETPVRKLPGPNWNMDQRTAAQMFSEVVRLVRNRVGGTFTEAYRRVLPGNRDLLEPDYDRSRCAQGFGRMLNRRERHSGLSPVVVTGRSAEEIAAMTQHFSPAFATAPAAFQWDILNRAAEVLAGAGVPKKIFNRAPAGVSASDLSAANSKAGEVLDFLSHRTETLPNNIGELLKDRNSSARQIWGTFYSQVKTLMSQNGISCEEAFNQLKDEQPLFWTMAMLSFDDGVTT